MENNKTHREYLLPPYQFGQFICQFTGGSKSSLVREKGGNVIVCSSNLNSLAVIYYFNNVCSLLSCMMVPIYLVTLFCISFLGFLQLLLSNGCCVTDAVRIITLSTLYSSMKWPMAIGKQTGHI